MIFDFDERQTGPLTELTIYERDRQAHDGQYYSGRLILTHDRAAYVRELLEEGAREQRRPVRLDMRGLLPRNSP